MKRINILNGLVVAMLVIVSSCRDFVEPNIPYSDFDNGAYLRTIRVASSSSVVPSLTFNYFNLGAAKFEATFEVVDNQGGASVDNVTVSVRHLRITATGAVNTPAQPVLIKTIPGTDFKPNGENRFTRATITITAAQAASAVGLSFDQLNGGDFFDFSFKMTTKDGRVWENANASADVRGGFFYDSPFFYRVGVVCPSDIAPTTGQTWVATSVSNFGTFTSNVTVTKSGSIRYIVSDVSAGLYAGFGFNARQEGIYEDACNTLNWVSAGVTQFALNNPGRTGSWNPTTGILTIPWFDSGNNIVGTTTLVKQ